MDAWQIGNMFVCACQYYRISFHLFSFLAGKTPLSCALYAGNAQIMKYLIDHGANPKKATAQGLTMLHIAAGRGDFASL